MKKQQKKISKWIYSVCVGLIIILAIFLRVWYLDRIPTGLVMDELDYVLNAKALYDTGSSITSDTWSFWSLTTAPDEVPKGEFPYVISMPFVGPFGLSILTARIGYAIVSVLFVIILFLTAKQLFGPWTGVAAGFLAAINPWSVYYGRTAYDVPIAITAYLLSFYLLIRLKGPALLLTTIPLFVAFYSYIGTKVLFVPFVFLSVIGSWIIVHKRKNTVWLFAVLCASLTIFLFFVLRINALDSNSRMNQIFTPFDQTIVKEVDSQRRMSLSSPLTTFFANKPIVYFKNVLIKFSGAFSPSLLFTNGEGVATFSLWEHGLFYPLDAIFLVVGFVAVYNALPVVFILFLLIITISTLPSVLSTVNLTYVHRASLMYPFFLIIMGYGLTKTISWFQGKKKLFAIGVVACLYMMMTANFVYLYFFRFPYYNSESFGLSQRLYTRYSALAEEHNKQVVYITNTQNEYFRNYLFYMNVPNTTTTPKIRALFHTGQFKWNNAIFTKTCPSESEIEDGQATYILSETSPCKELFINKPMVIIPFLADGGTLYMIFNDKLCTDYALSNYPTGFSIDDFEIEKLSEKRFCERFIIRYTQPIYSPLPEDFSTL